MTLSTAILAVLAAIASLLPGEHANEAMLNQIEASSQWSYYQAKSIKASRARRENSIYRRGLTNRINQSALVTKKSSKR